MKINVEFGSIAEMVNFGKFVGNDLVQVPPTVKQQAADLKYKAMYETTLANLEASAVEVLALSVRAMNCLHAEQIFTLKDLLKVSFYDLQKIPNCGRRTAREIQDAVERIGYKLPHTPNA
jgi:DNA-directed RNA polymerase alpha subunit